MKMLAEERKTTIELLQPKLSVIGSYTGQIFACLALDIIALLLTLPCISISILQN